MNRRLQNFIEPMIVGLVLLFVLLPVRVFFVQFVSDNWFGSFGLISALVFALVYLSKKKKLGVFGRMFWRQTIKVHKSKRKIFVYGLVGFMIYFWGATIYGINYGTDNEEIQALQQKFQSNMSDKDKQTMQHLENAIEAKDIQTTNQILKDEYSKMNWEYILIGIPVILALPFIEPNLWALMVTVINDFTNGYFLHFGTVFFVEQLEVVGILIYTGLVVKKEQPDQ